LWLFSQTVANELYNIRTNWNLMEHDVKLLCMSEKPQKYSIQVCPDSVFQTKPELKTLIVTSVKEGRRDPVKELAIYQSETEIMQALAAGAGQNKNDRKPGGTRKAANFPADKVAAASMSSTNIFAPAAGNNEADKKLADEVVKAPEETSRNISDDAEFDELLSKIRQGQKK